MDKPKFDADQKSALHELRNLRGNDKCFKCGETGCNEKIELVKIKDLLAESPAVL